MDWLKKNYDLALLGLAALLVASSALVIYSSGQESTVNTVAPPAPKAIPSATPDFAAIEAAKTLLSSTPAIASSPLKTSPFVSRSYLLKDGKLFDPIEGKEDLHPPLTNAWIIANELDYSNPRLAKDDPDQDSFTNEEEFLGHTDPNDPNDTPDRATKFKLVEFIPIPFRLEFKGDSGDGTLQINLKDLKGNARTQFKKIGSLVDAGPDKPPYKIIKYEPKERTSAQGVVTNVSELLIQNTVTNEQITLVHDVEIDDPTSTGRFIDMVNQEEHTLKKGEDFLLPKVGGRSFKVIDISEAGGEIEETNTGKKFSVLELKSEPPAPQ
jgi:hypothetical protein